MPKLNFLFGIANLYTSQKIKRNLNKCVKKAINSYKLGLNPFETATSFLALCHFGERNITYSPKIQKGCLYNLVYALLLIGLLREVTSQKIKIHSNYIDYLIESILSAQDSDGLFKDSSIANDIADIEDWWGWRHLTAHVITALAYFGAITKIPFKISEFLYGEGNAEKWIKSLDWDNKADFVSNTIMNYGVMLQYDRDYNGIEEAGQALKEIFLWLDKSQDPNTGLWGPTPFDTPQKLSIGVQTAYHIWILYFYDKRPIQYIDKCIDSCLKTQNKLGGYGVALNSSACEDMDSIDPLCRFYFLTDYRHSDIEESLKKAIPWILANQNEDGGFVFKRFQPFVYGHELMTTHSNESALFPTWFRILSLAYISKVLPNHPLFKGINFHFINCPGYQFWHE